MASDDIPRPDLFLKGSTFLQGKRAFLYAWKRNNEYLYIGATGNGMMRIYYHNVIGQMEPVLETDIIEIWYEKTENIFELESKYIEKLKPKYNTIKPVTSTSGKAICLNPNCKKEFSPRRPWQKFCKVKCQQERS